MILVWFFACVVKRDSPSECAMDSTVPQAMSPSSREILHDPRCERESMGTAIRTMSTVLTTSDENMATSLALSGCGVREALGTAREDSQRSNSTDRGPLKEIFLERDMGDTRESRSASSVSRSVVVITDSSKLQVAADLLTGLTEVAGDWSVREGKAYAFLGNSLEEVITRRTGDSPSQDSLRLLEIAAAKGVNVARSDCIEMDQRKDLSRMTDALEWLVPTGVCVVRGIMTADQVDLVIADVIETEVDPGSVAHVVQCVRSGVHSSGIDVERRSEGVAACGVGAFQTGGELSRPPEEDFFIPRDPALPSKVRALSSPPSSRVPSNVSSQMNQGMRGAKQTEGSPSKIRSPASLGFIDPNDVSGVCFSMGKASPMLCNGQSKDGVSTGLSSFRSGVNCQGPAAHIESVDRTSVIADLPSKAICGHRYEAALRDLGKVGDSPVLDLRGGEGVIDDQSQGLERVGVKTSKKAIPLETPVPQEARCRAVSAAAVEFTRAEGSTSYSVEISPVDPRVSESQPLGFRPGPCRPSSPVFSPETLGFESQPSQSSNVKLTLHPSGSEADSLDVSPYQSLRVRPQTHNPVPSPGSRRVSHGPSVQEVDLVQQLGHGCEHQRAKSDDSEEWPGQQLRGDEQVSAEHDMTIPNVGPAQTHVHVQGRGANSLQVSQDEDRWVARDLSPRTLGSCKPRLLPVSSQEVRSMPGSAGASDSFGADKDQAGSARLIQGQQMNTIGLQSGDTAGDMPQVSGATSGDMPQVSGATSSDMPRVSGATSGDMPQVSGATSSDMPQVSGATSSDMPRVSGATSGDMPQVSGATSSDMPQVSGATPSDMPQVSGATSSEMLQGSGATSDKLQGRQAQGTEAHGPSCLKSIRFSLPSHEGQGKSPGQGSAAQVGMTGAHKDQTGPKCTRPGSTGAHKDQAGPMCFLPGSKGAHKDQAGSGRESQVSKDASRSSGTLSSRQDVTGLRVRVMHLDAKVQVDCGRVRACRAPANRIKYSMKYDRSHNHLNPSPLGFSPEPATFQVPQPVGFNSELGSADSQTPPSGLNGQSMREVLRAQWGSDGVQMDRLRDTNQELMGCWLGLTGFLGLKEVQPILCGFLGPDVLTWLSVGKASIATLYRVSRTLGACSKGIEQAIRGQVASSIPWDSGLDRATPGQCADGQFRQGSPFPAHGISTASAASWLGAGVEAGHKDSVLPPNPFEDQKLAWFLLLKSDQLGSFINRAEVFRLIICGGAIGALAKIMLEGQCASSERSRPMPNQRTKVDSSRDRAVCPHHAKGFCRYGGTCKFLHQDPIPVGTPVPAVDKPSPDMKDSVCKHFAAGWCRRGNSCKFPHSVLSPAVKPELRSSGQEGPAVGASVTKGERKHKPL